MNRLLILAASMLPLAGCVQGQAEFSALPGQPKLTQAKLMQAKGYCQMRMSDQVDRQIARYGALVGPNPIALVDDAKACFMSQGVLITGFRHKDGSVHQNPFGRDAGTGRFDKKPARAGF
ncbi:hypothetical protein [Phyllobacterium lublinensis]|uniref:hypothetical protein n=1 Tax=Phyllobacterium lublinensis TaxID=2875708 RepID=UPI001CCCD0D5|nr:hypothetical protein [Phyllobacterium sp. 2063]MBZ9653830.1 hypothetical protein [Phyllobacterium sp. 2063]